MNSRVSNISSPSHTSAVASGCNLQSRVSSSLTPKPEHQYAYSVRNPQHLQLTKMVNETYRQYNHSQYPVVVINVVTDKGKGLAKCQLVQHVQ